MPGILGCASGIFEIEHAARRSLARLARRDGDFTLACELWNIVLGNTIHGI
jgi:hypothetical protein